MRKVVDKGYDFSIQLKAKEFEELKNGNTESMVKKYDKYLSQRIENACYSKYSSSLLYLYSDSRVIRGCIQGEQTFMVRFYNKKEYLICECRLGLGLSYESGKWDRLTIDIIKGL